jgi:hypothetical protein
MDILVLAFVIVRLKIKRDLIFPFFCSLELLMTDVPSAETRCGPNGKPYPSRNPNNPIGCWCKNGTHIEEIEEDGPEKYCL